MRARKCLKATVWMDASTDAVPEDASRLLGGVLGFFKRSADMDDVVPGLSHTLIDGNYTCHGEYTDDLVITVTKENDNA